MNSSRSIQPGTLCLVIRSTAGNEGREVTALSKVEAGHSFTAMDGAVGRCNYSGWLVEARQPLRTRNGRLTLRGVFPESDLLPLPPLDEPDTLAATEPNTAEWLIERMKRLRPREPA